MPQVKGHQAGLFSVGAGSGLCALQAFDGLNEAHPPCEGPRLHSASPPRQSHPETPSQTHPEERSSPCPAPCSHGPVRLTHATDTHTEAHSRVGGFHEGSPKRSQRGVSPWFRKETQDTAELRAGDGGLVPPKLERQRWFRALREDCHQEGPPGRAGNMSAPAPCPCPHALGPFWGPVGGNSGSPRGRGLWLSPGQRELEAGGDASAGDGRQPAAVAAATTVPGLQECHLAGE